MPLSNQMSGRDRLFLDFCPGPGYETERDSIISIGVHLLYTNLGKQRLFVWSCGDYSYQRTRLEKCLGLEIKLGSHYLLGFLQL